MVTDIRSRLNISDEALAEFCRKWKIVRLELFGSALRDDFDPEKSDIDLLVTFADNVSWGFRDTLKMEDELKAVLGRDVDMPERSTIETMKNWIRRKDILSSARVIFET